MIDKDPDRRPTPEALGRQFWQLLHLVVPESTTLRDTWDNIDLLDSKNLLSTDSRPKHVAPRWEQVLFQGSPHSHNVKTLERAKRVADARERLLGESHAQTMHSKARYAWTNFYMSPAAEENSSELFQKLLSLKEQNSAVDREMASYLAGIGWSEYVAENYDESSLMFEKALEIQAKFDSLDADSLSYTAALAKVQLRKAQINMMKSGRKRKRPGSEDVASGRSQAARALEQLQLCYNCQRFSRELGKDHPETAETMISIGWAYHCLATTRKDELIPTKLLKQYSQSAEIHYKEALEVVRKSLGDDHPLTLGTLHEMAHFDLINGRIAEGIQKLEEALEKQTYVFGIEDPDTQATINSLRLAYKLCGETKKLKDLSSQVGNGSRRVKRRRLMINELENGSDNEVDTNGVDQLSSQASL
jgi:tetratricopeptide (TPR) repeat protein